jgi:hypothetical protein
MLRKIRGALVFFVLLSCLGIVLLAFGGLAWFIVAIFSFGSERDLEWVDLSGTTAHRRVVHWPMNVPVDRVSRLSLFETNSRDSHLRLLKVHIDAEFAQRWSEYEHRRLSQELIQLQGPRWSEIQAIQQSHPTIPQPSEAPVWWTPREFARTGFQGKATEAMLWYTGNDSGVGKGVTTLYDPTDSILWVYRFSSQHRLLWKRGDLLESDALWDPKTGQWLSETVMK